MPLRTLSLLVLALAGLAHAAPAPFSRPAPPPGPDVELSGDRDESRLPSAPARVVANQADYRTVCALLGVAEPPRVDFRTQVVVVTTEAREGVAEAFDLSPQGDLRVMTVRGLVGCKLRSSELLPRYRLKSYSRASVTSVNGVPLPPAPRR